MYGKLQFSNLTKWHADNSKNNTTYDRYVTIIV